MPQSVNTSQAAREAVYWEHPEFHPRRAPPKQNDTTVDPKQIVFFKIGTERDVQSWETNEREKETEGRQDGHSAHKADTMTNKKRDKKGEKRKQKGDKTDGQRRVGLQPSLFSTRVTARFRRSWSSLVTRPPSASSPVSQNRSSEMTAWAILAVRMATGCRLLHPVLLTTRTADSWPNIEDEEPCPEPVQRLDGGGLVVYQLAQKPSCGFQWRQITGFGRPAFRRCLFLITIANNYSTRSAL